MPPCSPAAMKWKKPGRSSTQSRKRGAPKKTSQLCACIPPARGVPKKPTNFWRATVGRGEDSDWSNGNDGQIIQYSVTPTLHLPRFASRDREDRSGAKTALGRRRRSKDPGVA